MPVRRLDEDGLAAVAVALGDATVLARYRAKIVTVTGSECRWWAHAVSGRGHGRFWLARGRVVIAHRFGFAVMHGVEALADAPLLGHRCDNPLLQRIAPGHVEVSSALRNRREWSIRRNQPDSPLADPRGPRRRASELRAMAASGRRTRSRPSSRPTRSRVCRTGSRRRRAVSAAAGDVVGWSRECGCWSDPKAPGSPSTTSRSPSLTIWTCSTTESFTVRSGSSRTPSSRPTTGPGPRSSTTLKHPSPTEPGAHQPYHHGSLRGELLGHAHVVLRTEGPEALWLRDLGRRAGVSPSAPFRHFATKADLLDALAGDGYRELVAGMREALDSESSPAARLHALARRYVDLARRNPPLLRLMTGRRKSTWDAGDLGELAGSAFALLEGVVREGQAAGDVRAGDPSDLTVAAWSTMHGLAALVADGMLEAAPPESGQPGPGVIISTTVDVLLRGLCPGA